MIINVFGFGFTTWKKNYIRRFFESKNEKIIFIWKAKQVYAEAVNENSIILNWGQRALSEAQIVAAKFSLPLGRVEDGFIRSVGLGSDLTPPLSLVLDKTGIYYDPTQPSDLETLFETYDFSSELKVRASNIRQMLIENAVSKYNVGKKLLNNVVQSQAGQTSIFCRPSSAAWPWRYSSQDQRSDPVDRSRAHVRQGPDLEPLPQRISIRWSS